MVIGVVDINSILKQFSNPNQHFEISQGNEIESWKVSHPRVNRKELQDFLSKLGDSASVYLVNTVTNSYLIDYGSQSNYIVIRPIS